MRARKPTIHGSVHPTLDWSKASKNDIERFCAVVTNNISALSFGVHDCVSPSCSGHCAHLDSYTLALINILVESSHKCIPFRSVAHQKLAGWSKKAKGL